MFSTISTSSELQPPSAVCDEELADGTAHGRGAADRLVARDERRVAAAQVRAGLNASGSCARRAVRASPPAAAQRAATLGGGGSVCRAEDLCKRTPMVDYLKVGSSATSKSA
jgi:hypothetical protein